jgi:hypothetical protein
VGLYFVPAGGGVEVKVDPSDIVVNNPSELIALIRSLSAGTYRVRIITQFSSSGQLLKVPHTVTYDKDLTLKPQRRGVFSSRDCGGVRDLRISFPVIDGKPFVDMVIKIV